jgi:hypothetical protein
MTENRKKKRIKIAIFGQLSAVVCRLFFSLGHWNLEFVWDLVLGIWDLKRAGPRRRPYALFFFLLLPFALPLPLNLPTSRNLLSSRITEL